MPCPASADAAETANGAVERMRMVLFSFTNAYYTKKLPRNLPRSKLDRWLLGAAVRGGRCLAGLGAEPDLAARRFRGRQLLHELAQAALDLLDVTFGGIHTPPQLGDLPHLVHALQQHLAENTGRPAPKSHTFRRFHPIANGY